MVSIDVYDEELDFAGVDARPPAIYTALSAPESLSAAEFGQSFARQRHRSGRRELGRPNTDATVSATAFRARLRDRLVFERRGRPAGPLRLRPARRFIHAEQLNDPLIDTQYLSNTRQRRTPMGAQTDTTVRRRRCRWKEAAARCLAHRGCVPAGFQVRSTSNTRSGPPSPARSGSDRDDRRNAQPRRRAWRNGHHDRIRPCGSSPCSTGP